MTDPGPMVSTMLVGTNNGARRPGICAVVITTSLCLLLYPSQEFKSLSGVTAGLIIYECIQPYIPERTFDVMDILATAAGAVLMLTLIITRRKTAKALTHLSDS